MLSFFFFLLGWVIFALFIIINKIITKYVFIIIKSVRRREALGSKTRIGDSDRSKKKFTLFHQFDQLSKIDHWSRVQFDRFDQWSNVS
jgi:hypothetical protein